MLKILLHPRRSHRIGMRGKMMTIDTLVGSIFRHQRLFRVSVQ